MKQPEIAASLQQILDQRSHGATTLAGFSSSCSTRWIAFWTYLVMRIKSQVFNLKESRM